MVTGMENVNEVYAKVVADYEKQSEGLAQATRRLERVENECARSTGRLERTTAQGNTSAEKERKKTGSVSTRQKDSAPHSAESQTKQLQQRDERWKQGEEHSPNATTSTAKGPKHGTQLKTKFGTDYNVKSHRIRYANPQRATLKIHTDEKNF